MYYTGVNIGGLFSQNKNFSDEYLDNFITENDIKRISNWGFNLIRLPVDYYFFEYDSKPFIYDLKRIKRIDDFFKLAGKYNLKVILDFHIVPGYTFEADKLEFNDIWDKNEILKLLKPVLEFRNKHNVPVLCGEFGCIIRADKVVRGRWPKDIIDIFKENKISYTYWTYKNMDFGIYDFTEEYKNNENYDAKDRLDSDTLKILQSGIEDSK